MKARRLAIQGAKATATTLAPRIIPHTWPSQSEAPEPSSRRTHFRKHDFTICSSLAKSGKSLGGVFSTAFWKSSSPHLNACCWHQIVKSIASDLILVRFCRMSLYKAKCWTLLTSTISFGARARKRAKRPDVEAAGRTEDEAARGLPAAGQQVQPPSLLDWRMCRLKAASRRLELHKIVQGQPGSDST